MALKALSPKEGKSFLLTMKVLLKPKDMKSLHVSIKLFSLSLPMIEVTLSDRQ